MTASKTAANSASAAPPALALDAAADSSAANPTGTNSDNITNHTSALTISGSGENGAGVTLFDDTNNDGVQNGGELSLGSATRPRSRRRSRQLRRQPHRNQLRQHHQSHFGVDDQRLRRERRWRHPLR